MLWLAIMRRNNLILKRRVFNQRMMDSYKINKNGCWLWQHSINTYGYGCQWNPIKKKQELAHVVSYELFNHAKINGGLWGLHHCDNPSCINPDHIFVGTSRDNSWDKIKKGRDNYSSKYVKNTKLEKLIKKKYVSVLNFCEKKNLQPTVVFDYIRNINNPLTRINKFNVLYLSNGYYIRSSFAQIANFLERSPIELIPEDTLDLAFNKKQNLDCEPYNDNRMYKRTSINNRNIHRAIATLKPREQTVILMRFGFFTRDKTLEQIGNKIGVSKQRVQQIESKSLRKLKHLSRRKFFIVV